MGCLVLDVRLPGMSGLDFQVELAGANIDIPIIFLTGHADIPMSVKAMKAGAVEFLTKPVREQDLLDAINVALGRDRARRENDERTRMLRARFQSLSGREREVMSLVITGMRNKEIADELKLSEMTVKVHRHKLMEKLGAKSVPSWPEWPTFSESPRAVSCDDGIMALRGWRPRSPSGTASQPQAKPIASSPFQPISGGAVVWPRMTASPGACPSASLHRIARRGVRWGRPGR